MTYTDWIVIVHLSEEVCCLMVYTMHFKNSHLVAKQLWY